MAQEQYRTSTYCTIFGAALLCLLLFQSSVSHVSARCPSRDDSFCLQVDGFDTIILDGNKFADIKKVFRNIKFLFDEESETTELDQLMLINNQNLKKLDRNAFGDFRFRRIVIRNCTNLEHFDPEAFNGTKQIIRAIKFDHIAVNDGTQESFFDALNSIENLEELEIYNHKIRKIRSYTFRQSLLAKLHLGGPLEELDNNAFFYLYNVRILHLSKSLNHVRQHAFDMKAENNKSVDIYLDGKLGKLERGVFTYTKRPLTINLYLKKLAAFDAAIFRPILAAPIAHEIIFHGNPKEMHNPCQLIWLFRHKFRGVFTFKDEPLINEAYFDPWQCSYHSNTAEDIVEEVPEIEEVSRAGIDSTNNAAPSVKQSLLTTVATHLIVNLLYILPFVLVI
ncbi:hypothetical protein TYRP_000266 [Tyrophagus putrescentiae]|nr:hypothetical protein TYRP_000266 [Tyrophagus putrescentiae]